MSDRAMQTERMFHALGTTDALEEAFSDASYLAAMLRFEVALARAQARLGLIPGEAARGIETAAAATSFDAAALARAARQSGTVAIPLVAALKESVRRHTRDALPFVHRAATSQDVTDTALVLCLVRAKAIVAADHGRLVRTLRRLSDAHARTIMLARTLGQPAAPTTFGLKVAGWFGAVSRAGARLLDTFDGAAVLQFGGPAGTLAALDGRGQELTESLAAELDLAVPAAPWHSHRDRLAALVTACGVYTGALGKIARDVSLLMQSEVAEASERGGSSSAMPHKRNPANCAIALAAATRVPGLVASYLAGLAQEHERGLGNWHAEGATIVDTVCLTGAALLAIVDAIDGLEVDAARMRANLDATGGVIFAERALALLSPLLGPDQARTVIDAAIDTARTSRTTFVDVLSTDEAVRSVARADELASLWHAETYLGSAEQFRRRLLDADET